MSLRAQWCALEMASMATTQPAGGRAHYWVNLSLSRASARPVSTRPAESTS